MSSPIRRPLLACVVAAAAASGCGGSDRAASAFTLLPTPAPAPTSPPSAPPPSPAPAPVAQPALLNTPDEAGGCAAVAALAAELSAAGRTVSITSTKIAKTTATDASGNPQSYCAVAGTINGGRKGLQAAGQTDAMSTYAIAFQINLPTRWNGRMFMSGGGGSDGSVPDTTGAISNGETVQPLLSGYATVSNDSGHSNATNNDPNNAGTASFGLDPVARVDFGYNAIGQTKQLANQLVARYYAKKQDYAYFMGCSEGGREAMMVSQRFGDEFDGVVAGDPGSDLPKAWLAEAWDTQQFAAAAQAQGFLETTGPGASNATPLMNAAFQPAQWAALQQAVLAKCDADDGLVDGMINKRSCTFDVSTLACGAPGAPGAPGCLVPAQVTAMQKVMGGVKNSAGDALYSDWPWDAGIGAFGWQIWKTGFGYRTSGANDAINATLGGGAGPLIFTTPPTQGLATGNSLVQFQLRFDWDADAPKIKATDGTYTESAYSFMGTHSTDMSKLKGKGGKLILYHGTSDPVFSFNYTAKWVDSLAGNTANGTVKDFVRLFAVPGMNHCSGGPATDTFPVFSAVVDWVEKGKAPDRLIASSKPGNPDTAGWTLPAGVSSRVRPLCPYPQYAQYIGTTGSAPAALLEQNDPGKFVCAN